MITPYLHLIRREYQTVQTPGKLFYINNRDIQLCPRWESLEAGWGNNIDGCFPEGIYAVVREHSDKFGVDLWELYNVPNRSECKIHWGNYYKNFDGCVGIGKDKADINKDGFMDITSTKEAVEQLMEVTKPFKYLPLLVTGPMSGWQIPKSASYAYAFS